MNTSEVSILVTPFFPFNKALALELVDRLNMRANVAAVDYIELSDINDYDSYLKFYSEKIDKINHSVVIVSFGAFSQFAIGLSVLNRSKVAGVVFIEPDFTGVLSVKLKWSIFKSRIKSQVVKIFVGSKRINSKFLSTENTLKYFNIVKQLRNVSNCYKLSDFINTKVQSIIIWSAMSAECWPLPQILTEEYEIPVINSGENIVSFIHGNKQIFIENF